jgi:hypothetical protein
VIYTGLPAIITISGIIIINVFIDVVFIIFVGAAAVKPVEPLDNELGK